MLRVKRIIALFLLLAIVILPVYTLGVNSTKTKTLINKDNDINSYALGTNRYTRYVEPTAVTNCFGLEGYEKKMENDLLEVWYGKDLETLRIVDKRTDYIWGCTSGIEADGLNKKWQSIANSIVSVSYCDIKNNETTVGLSDSVFKTKYKWKENTATCEVSSKKLMLSFSFKIELKDNSLIFSIEDKSIEDSRMAQITAVSFLNFFGSSKGEDRQGYLLIPDGSGALIRFKNSKNYASAFHKKVYGADYAIDSVTQLNNLNGNRTDDYATEENTATLPVFGIVHGERQNAFLAVINSGKEYSTISAIPAGAESASVGFTRAYVDFRYRSLYNKRVSGTKTVLTPQEEKNKVNPSISYTFLNGNDADYSGMARYYRKMLLEDGTLKSNKNKSDTTPILLNVMMSEVTKGFLSNKNKVLTTVDELTEIVERLNKDGITSPTVIVSGWQTGGMNGVKYGDLDINKKIGDRKALDALSKRLEVKGGSLNLAVNSVTANKDQVNLAHDIALNATTDPIKITVPNKTLMYPDTYYYRNQRTNDCLKSVSSKYSNYGILAEGIGKYLYSDYTVDSEVTRDEALKNISDTIKGFRQEILLDGANSYLLPYADAIINTPVTNSQYAYESDSVPFLQMVLRGSVNYYSPYSNQGFYSTESILKMIEYGSFPSFMIMNADNFSLYKTPLENYFSLCFDDWEDRIISVYGSVDNALSKVSGAEITTHNVIADGVVRVSYSNGVNIFVNYSNSNYPLEDGNTVPTAGYFIKE